MLFSLSLSEKIVKGISELKGLGENDWESGNISKQRREILKEKFEGRKIWGVGS